MATALLLGKILFNAYVAGQADELEEFAEAKFETLLDGRLRASWSAKQEPRRLQGRSITLWSGG